MSENSKEMITITKEEYDDLMTKAIDWENMHIIMDKCRKDVAYDSIRVILGIWEEQSKELKVVEI